MSLKNRQQELVNKFVAHPSYFKKGKEVLADLFKVSVENIELCKYEAKKILGKSIKNDNKAIINNYVATLEDVITKVDNNKGTLESTIESTFEPKNDIELAKLHKIDLTKYKISTYWSKLKSNGKFTSSVLCTLKKIEDTTGEDLLLSLSKYKSNYKPLSKKDILLNQSFLKPTCAFFDITDYHLDKRDVFETPIEQKIKDYHLLLDKMLYKAYQSNNIDEIVFVIGSDMLHTDNFFNQTTKGTQQETTVRWNEAFDIAFDIYVESINKLKQFCNRLNVILVAGNHGRTKEYYLAFALSKYFEKEENVIFDISAAPRKVFTYGNTFIGLHHGNTKIETLPLVYAKEFREQWGQSKYHEIKVGDKHHFMEKDYQGVRIKQLPACSQADTWHNDSNYVNSEQSAICTIYDYEKGRCMDIEERL
jgi:hypothetical protein